MWRSDHGDQGGASDYECVAGVYRQPHTGRAPAIRMIGYSQDELMVSKGFLRMEWDLNSYLNTRCYPKAASPEKCSY